MNHLELKAVSKRFGGVVAVDNVSFSVPRRGFWGLMGANGAGKTTLFSLIAGTHAPSSGDVLLDGQSMVRQGPAASCRLGVARTFQIVRPFRDMTVHETACVAAMYGRHRRDFQAAREYAYKSISAAGLESLADRAAGELTLSNQKRLELARALATGGELLLLDEIMAYAH
jgi:branched-chain amino acid transport system ATP-binding protein